MTDKNPTKLEKWQQLAAIAKTRKDLKLKKVQNADRFRRLTPKQIDFCYDLAQSGEYRSVSKLATQYDVSEVTIKRWKTNRIIQDFILLLKAENQQHHRNYVMKKMDQMLATLHETASMEFCETVHKGKKNERKIINHETVRLRHEAVETMSKSLSEIAGIYGFDPKLRDDKLGNGVNIINNPQAGAVGVTSVDPDAPLTPVREATLDETKDYLKELQVLSKDEDL